MRSKSEHLLRWGARKAHLFVKLSRVRKYLPLKVIGRGVFLQLTDFIIYLLLKEEFYMFISTKRGIVSAVLSLLFIFYAFNFVPRNINIIATRSLPRQIFAYVLNFVIFFIVIYLIATLIAYLAKKFSPKSK